MKNKGKWLFGGSLLLLALVSFNGPLEMAYNNGEPPRGIRSLNFIIELLSPIAGPRTFFYLIVVIFLFWGLRGFKNPFEDKSKPKQDQKDGPHVRPDMTDSERQLVSDMMEGLVAQVEHGRSLEALQQDQSFHVQLRPQVPIRGRATSWFGGIPSLPQDMAWPIGVDKYPMKFIAQLDLSGLPAALWDGLGPRTGWLLFFSEYDNGGIKVIHSHAFGSLRQQPSIPPGRKSKYAHWFYHGPDVYDDPPSTPREHPQWPIDIVEVAAGTNSDNWTFGYAWSTDENPSFKAQLFNTEFNLLDSRFLPFDWQSLWYLVRATRHPVKFGRKWAEDNIRSLPSYNKKLRDERPDDFEARIEKNNRSIADATKRLTILNATLSKIEALENEIERSKTQREFTAEIRDHYLTEIRQLNMQGCNTQNPDNPEQLSFTSPEKVGGWLDQYIGLLLNYWKQIYSADPSQLPSHITPSALADFKYHADREYGVSGNHPLGYVHEYNETTDITLLQLPTSGLMDWMWGDMYHLVLTIEKSALQRHDFSQVKFQISN